ncbi:MAG: hypothetical protein V1712_02080 [Patescibacteria group bacterium]
MLNSLNPPATEEDIRMDMDFKEQQRVALIQKCRATGYWDGKIREGFPTQVEMELAKAKFCQNNMPSKTVLIQLALQIRQTGYLTKKM